MDNSQEIERLFREIEDLEQLIFEAKARHHVREYLQAGWITQEQSDKILSLFGEPCL